MTKTKTLLAVAALALTPTLAAAECSYGKQQQASTCATGAVWDADAGKCVATTG
ncbi:hypothetical protein C8N43_1165 [Litoreibacter ponti]|uniref:Chitin binding peritrophin-A-like protein n=1 Tax=Litoreibacter ponti TaxID=1510457 RepID=A0A2T6BKD3_9RHOB|nr:hypothetical protein [Litoreibacter ponti]PTX56506.1 hypothetical protein C8N43_1165 [Litoreibacter ponti]